MQAATFRFYEELNDFLPLELRKVEFRCGFKGRESVKDMIEALGVPHTEEKRTILTKSRKLLKHRDVIRGIFIRPGTTVEQVRGIIDFLSLRGCMAPFSRCLACNSSLVRVTKESVFDRVPPKARAFHEDYSYCSGCDRIYWQGTHFARIRKVVGEILAR